MLSRGFSRRCRRYQMPSEVWCEILNVLKCYVEKKCCKVYFSDKALNLWQKTKNLLEIVENLKIIVCYVKWLYWPPGAQCACVSLIL